MRRQSTRRGSPPGRSTTSIRTPDAAALSDAVGQVIAGGAAAAGVFLSAAQRDLLERYVHLVVGWNARLRLTGARDAADVARVLVAGAFPVVPLLAAARRIVDLGSGAGVPGIPVAVVRSDACVVLVEASRKKAGFLQIAVRELGLAQVEVACERAEVFGRDPARRERYDAVTARAVASLPVLVEYALPLLRAGGVAVLPRGAAAIAETAAARRALEVLGGRAQAQPPAEPGGAAIVVVHKAATTPLKYPRRPGQAAKQPL